MSKSLMGIGEAGEAETRRSSIMRSLPFQLQWSLQMIKIGENFIYSIMLLTGVKCLRDVRA